MADRARGMKKAIKKIFRGGSSNKRMRGAQSDEDYSPSHSATDDVSEFGQSTNEVEMDDILGEDLVFDPSMYTGEKKVWGANEYSKARKARAYDQDNDSPTPQFYTRVQHDAFYGLLMNKTVFAHQSIDWNFIGQFPTVSPLIAKFKDIGLYDFMGHRQDWNDIIVRQFYATVEIDFPNKTLSWMTNSKLFTATFAEFATANEIDYALTEGTLDVFRMDPYKDSESLKFYFDDHRPIKLGTVTGLQIMPKVINKIVRKTFYCKSGNPEAIRDYYWNIIDHIMEGTVFDVVHLIMTEIENYSLTTRTNLYYAPYIMSLIRHKTLFPSRHLTVRHTPYQPFASKKRELMPPPDAPAQGEEDDDAGDEAAAPQAPQAPQAPPVPPPQPQFDWSQMPPPPPQFFSGLGTYMDQYFQPVMQRLDQVQASHVEARNSYEAARTSYEAARTSIDALTTRMQSLEANYDALSAHLYGYFPAPMPPPGFYYQEFAPPPPPPQDD